MLLQDFIFHTYIRMRKILLLISGLLISTVASFSQDSGALIEALIRKGILSNQEAEDIRADLVKENNTIPAHAMAGGKSTDRLSIGMRMQQQYASLDTNLKSSTVGPVATDHFFTRRMYLTLKAGIGGDWGAVMTYDLAGGSYDDAIVEWKPTPDLSFNFGLRKVNVVYEERGSSGNLKAIERSGVTRYFVETNNGRRLGAASYRIGVFLDGKKDITNTFAVVYSAAITNPERDETFAGAAGTGNNATNRKAFWGNVGLTAKLPENGSVIVGVGSGLLPDQGGPSNTNLGKGYDTSLYSVYFDLTYKRFGLLSEYLMASIERGASLSKDAKPSGWFIQPSFMLTETVEAVVRYQQLDTDGRGVNLGDVVRSAPVGATMNKFNEWYVGGNWYIKSNDLKFQLGLISGKTQNTLANLPDEAKTVGVRSQLQLQF
jgi:polyhydroxyalkanoate synthesis regulator phasin